MIDAGFSVTEKVEREASCYRVDIRGPGFYVHSENLGDYWEHDVDDSVYVSGLVEALSNAIEMACVKQRVLTPRSVIARLATIHFAPEDCPDDDEENPMVKAWDAIYKAAVKFEGFSEAYLRVLDGIAANGPED